MGFHGLSKAKGLAWAAMALDCLDGPAGARERLQPHGMEIPSTTEDGSDLTVLRVSHNISVVHKNRFRIIKRA